MMQNFCEFAPDYLEQIRRLRQPDALRAGARIIQFPFALPVVEEKTEEELARITERRREQGKKLQEIAAKNRQEKLEAKERDRDFMLKLKEDRPDTKREWMVRCPIFIHPLFSERSGCRVCCEARASTTRSHSSRR